MPNITNLLATIAIFLVVIYFQARPLAACLALELLMQLQASLVLSQPAAAGRLAACTHDVFEPWQTWHMSKATGMCSISSSSSSSSSSSVFVLSKAWQPP